jgi:hypothetical protein
MLVLAFLLPLGMALPSGAAASRGARPVFEYASDSLHATLTLIGGPGAQGRGSLPIEGRQVACGWERDSAAGDASPGAGPPVWYEVFLRDERAGAESRFPIDGAALRKGLRKACEDGGRAEPARIAAGLRALAIALKVRRQGPENGVGE